MLQQLSRTNVQVSKLCEAHVHKTSTHITSIFCAVVAVPRLDYIAQEAQRRTCNTVCENDQFCQSSVQWMNCTEDCAVSEPHGRLCSEWTARKIVQWVNCTEDCAVNELHGRLCSEWIPRKTVQWMNSTEDCAVSKFHGRLCNDEFQGRWIIYCQRAAKSKTQFGNLSFDRCKHQN